MIKEKENNHSSDNGEQAKTLPYPNRLAISFLMFALGLQMLGVKAFRRFQLCRPCLSFLSLGWVLENNNHISMSDSSSV